MGPLRPETEVDRTQAALNGHSLTLPLQDGTVEVFVRGRVLESTVGQRIVVMLIGELARMKGVVRQIHLVTDCDTAGVVDTVPLRGSDAIEGLSELVSGLNLPSSEYRVELRSGRADHDAVRVHVGEARDLGVSVGADGWRAMLGTSVVMADWDAAEPYGGALAAALGASEVYKRLLAMNGVDDAHPASEALVFSAFNYGRGEEAAIGPPVHELQLESTAIVGCGAGGSAAAYVLGMQPGLRGSLALIEPGVHKLSNLNRYLMTTATDVHEARHKLSTVSNHLATFAPGLQLVAHGVRWEMRDQVPWRLLLSTVDTKPARWSIQQRSRPEATILDGAVVGNTYAIGRMVPGGWCIECRLPYDPDHHLQERAAMWGQSVATIREWSDSTAMIADQMIERLTTTQNAVPGTYDELLGQPFKDAPALMECGTTRLTAAVPSQAPVLPIATTPVGALLAAEVAKAHVAPDAGLDNSLHHDLERGIEKPRVRHRPVRQGCPNHRPATDADSSAGRGRRTLR